MKITSITLIFENVEEITIESSNIKQLVLENVMEKTTLILNEDKEMEKQNTTRVGIVYLVIDKKADVYYNTYGEVSDMTVFERIQKYSDITEIEVEYENEESKYYRVSWDKAIIEEENAGEEHRILKDGSLYIKID